MKSPIAIISLFFTFVLSLCSFARTEGLFDTLNLQQSEYNRNVARTRDQQRAAALQSATASYLVNMLQASNGTTVGYEGRSNKAFGIYDQYNVGGIWGCAVYIPNRMGLGVSCINKQTGVRQNFSRQPLDIY